MVRALNDLSIAWLAALRGPGARRMIKMDFRSIYSQGFCTRPQHARRHAVWPTPGPMRKPFSLAAEVDAKAAALAVFPELALSGYAIDDLLLQDTLHAAIAVAVERLVTASADLLPLILVGAPLRYEGRLYNCALAIHRGRLLGVIPKGSPADYREFYERRHFASGHGTSGEIVIGGLRAPFGPDLLFVAEDVLVSSFMLKSARSLGAGAAIVNCSAGRRDGSRQSFGQQHYHRQERNSAIAHQIAIAALPRRLSLFRGRERRNRRPISLGTARRPSPRTAPSSPNRHASPMARNSCSPISILTSSRRNVCGKARSTITAAISASCGRFPADRLSSFAAGRRCWIGTYCRALSVRSRRPGAFGAGLL